MMRAVASRNGPSDYSAGAVAITGGTIAGVSSVTSDAYKSGVLTGVDASIVIPTVATITVTKGIITAVV